MQTADFNPDDFKPEHQSRADETLMVRFFTQPMLDNQATKKAGRPVYTDREFIDIKVPGSRTGGDVHLVRQRDIVRFPRHYEAFKQRTEAPETGTPLSEWPMVSRSQAEELAFFNVKTVEQLATMPDNHAQSFHNALNLKQKAKEWLEMAEASTRVSEIGSLQSALDEKDAQIAALTEKMAELESKISLASDEPAAQASSTDSDDAPAPPPTRRRRKKAEPEG
jgi:hypothetical protein